MISFSDAAHKGSLYTLFLHSPLSAFCFVTNIVDIPIHMWDKVSYHYLFFHIHEKIEFRFHVKKLFSSTVPCLHRQIPHRSIQIVNSQSWNR